jgi:hypothetical protein
MGMIFGRHDDDDWRRQSSGWSWWTRSSKDPRFNLSGYALSMWGAKDEVNKAVLAKEKQLGVQAPDDLEYGGNKP